MDSERITIVKNYYKAYAESNREFVENLITDDFTFSSPPDPLLTRETYFERCWPGAGNNQAVNFLRLFEHEDEVIVTYESNISGQSKGRNTEIISFRGNEVCRVEVYFGWTINN